MSWVTAVWSMIASACLTLALVQGMVWWWRRETWANLLLSATAVSTMLLAAVELWIMRSETPEALGTALRWLHVPAWMLVLSLVAFVRLYFQTGRPWLAWTICGLRTLSLLLNFSFQPNLNFLKITAVRRVVFLGEPVSIADGVPNPWMLVGQLSLLLLVIFVADAAVAVWRRGSRRQALVVGGSVILFAVMATGQAILSLWGVIPTPITASLFYLGIVAAMGFELSRDVFRAAELARDLRESEERLTLAAGAAHLGVWNYDLARNEMWATDEWRALFGFSKSEPLDLSRYLQRLHPEDREAVREVREQAIAGGGRYETEYRIVLPDGRIRWIASRGGVEFNGAGHAVLVRGVSIDITQRKQAEEDLHDRQRELAHLSRVTMLGELSGSMAHELNQPLTAILSNAQAAQRYLARETPDLVEVRAILTDIVTQDERAGEVIRRLHLLLKKGEFQQQPLDANEVVLDVLKLIRSDLSTHGVTVETQLAPDLPRLRGDRVQLQQVLLNLVMNASDAMSDNAANDRLLTVRTFLDSEGRLRIEVSDVGRGLPPGGAELPFERFFTTKPKGLGLGLAVCRTIVTAHGGAMGAADNPGRGVTFHCTLPLAGEPRA